MNEDQIAKMEHGIGNLPGQYKLVEQTYGQDVLNLVLARGYIARLLDMRFFGIYWRVFSS